jgi:uncharacterized protein (DUF1501 family)
MAKPQNKIEHSFELHKESRRSFIGKLLFKDDEPPVLVCIFLRGGADTLNMFVPYEDADYYRLRPSLAIKPPRGSDKSCAIAVGDDLAFHPALAPLVPIYKEGLMAIVDSVGSDNQSGSHFEAQDQIEHGVSALKPGITGGGWLGRHLLCSAESYRSPLAAVAMAASLPEALRGAPAASAIASLSDLELKVPADAHFDADAVAKDLSRLYGADCGILGESGKNTVELLARMKKLRLPKKASAQTSSYPSGRLGKSLSEIARLIKAKVGLEVACVDHGGWDTHFFQGTEQGLQANNIDELAKSLAAFHEDVGGDVTVLVYTEFGRRIYENGSLGTDHGRGFSLFALGSKIKGGRHGSRPPLKDEKDFELGPSGLPILIDYRSVLAEIVGGVLNNHRLDRVFPQFQPQWVGLVDCRS